MRGEPMSVFESLLNNSFSVERRQRVSDGQGGWIVVYVAVGTVEGRICPTSSKERVVADSEEQQITHVLYTVAGEDIARGDRVTCGDLVVEVLGIREPSEADEHWEIDCLERQYEENEEVGS
jgi:SPP1 family predicted phage head-tail adaptor